MNKKMKTCAALNVGMRAIVLAFMIGVVSVVPAAAQTPFHRFYVAATGAVDSGSRGNISGVAVPSGGGLVGFRLTRAWSVELEVEQAFHRSSSSSEGSWISLAGPISTRQEIERLAIRARFDRSEEAGPGASAHVVWRTNKEGRLNGGLFGGLSARQYRTRTLRTVVSVPPEVSLSPDDWRLQPEDAGRTMTGGGVVLGGLVFVRFTSRLTFAPEARFTVGKITDDPYQVLRIGGRLMWSF